MATSSGLYSTTILKAENTIWVKEGANNIGNVIIDNIDARNTDGFIAIATQGNGVYATNYAPSSVNDPDFSKRFTLGQNFPNPATNITTISFTIQEKGFVKLEVSDINGKIIKTLMEESCGQGEHRVSMNTNELSTGLYFYRLSLNESVITKKMSVLH